MVRSITCISSPKKVCFNVKKISNPQVSIKFNFFVIHGSLAGYKDSEDYGKIL